MQRYLSKKPAVPWGWQVSATQLKSNLRIVWLVASDNGFTCHYGQSRKALLQENSTTSLQSTNCGSIHVSHVCCKPEGIRPGGTQWKAYDLQLIQNVSKHAHTHTRSHTFNNSRLPEKDSICINFHSVILQIRQIFRFFIVFCEPACVRTSQSDPYIFSHTHHNASLLSL